MGGMAGMGWSAPADDHSGHDHGAFPHTNTAHYANMGGRMGGMGAMAEDHSGHDHGAYPHDDHSGHDHGAHPHTPTQYVPSMGGLSGLSGLGSLNAAHADHSGHDHGAFPHDDHSGHDHGAHPHTEAPVKAEPEAVIDTKAAAESEAAVETAAESEATGETAAQKAQRLAGIERRKNHPDMVRAVAMKASFVSGEMERNSPEFQEWKVLLGRKCPWYRQQLGKATKGEPIAFPFFGLLESGNGEAWSGDYSEPADNWDPTKVNRGRGNRGNRG